MAVAGGGPVFCKIHLGRGKNTTVADLSAWGCTFNLFLNFSSFFDTIVFMCLKCPVKLLHFMLIILFKTEYLYFAPVGANCLCEA